jgi:hypothetical protein
MAASWDPRPRRSMHRFSDGDVVVSVDGLAQTATWAVPTLVGVPLLELWYRRENAVRQLQGAAA